MCEFCEGTRKYILDNNSGFSAQIQETYGKFYIYMGYQGQFESDYDNFEIKFCPICSRELKAVTKNRRPVKVINSGRTYSDYFTGEDSAPKCWAKGKVPNNDSEGVVICEFKHRAYNRNLVLVDIMGLVYVIDNEGLFYLDVKEFDESMVK